MVKILEFKEFKRRLNPIYEDEAPAPEPPPPAPAGDAGAACQIKTHKKSN